MKKTYLQKGFTLIELLVVIAIVALLSSIILASLNNTRGKGQDAKIKSQLLGFRNLAEVYYSTNKAYSDGTVVAPVFVATGMGNPPSTLNDVFADTLAQKHILAINLPSGVLVFYTRDGDATGGKAMKYAMAVSLLSDTAKAWCVDSTNASKQETRAGANWVATDLFNSNLCK